jgi:hypothetical protein
MTEGLKIQEAEAGEKHNAAVGESVKAFWDIALVVDEARENGMTDHELMAQMAHAARIFLAHHATAEEWFRIREWADLSRLRMQLEQNNTILSTE